MNKRGDEMIKKWLLSLVAMLVFVSPALAEQWDAETFVLTGLEFMTGDGVPQNKKAGFNMFTAAAKLDDAMGQYLTGVSYDRGDGVAKNNAEAEKWILTAANQSYLDAQRYLGLAYYTGRWGNKNYSEAASWYKKAAENGDQFSMYSLGYLYDFGLGVPKDVQESKAWLGKAVANGTDEGIAYSAKQHLAAINKEEGLNRDLTADKDATATVAAMLGKAIEKATDGPKSVMPNITSPGLPTPTASDCSFSRRAGHPYGGSPTLSMNCTQY